MKKILFLLTVLMVVALATVPAKAEVLDLLRAINSGQLKGFDRDVASLSDYSYDDGDYEYDDYNGVNPCNTVVPGDLECDGLNISDVLTAIRHSVGLDNYSYYSFNDEESAANKALIYDVAPTRPVTVSDEYLPSKVVDVVLGDGQVNVADILVMLRASVNLMELDWATRVLTLTYEGEKDIQAVEIIIPASRRHMAGLVLDGPWPDFESLIEDDFGRLHHFMMLSAGSSWTTLVSYNYHGPFLGKKYFSSEFAGLDEFGGISSFWGAVEQKYEDWYAGELLRTGTSFPGLG